MVDRLGTIERGEERATLLAGTYFFFALASYFILRAVRDAAGVAAGTSGLPWLFTGTLITTLVLNPVYGSVVARLPVRRFIPIVYRVFIALLLSFAAVIRYGPPSGSRSPFSRCSALSALRYSVYGGHCRCS